MCLSGLVSGCNMHQSPVTGTAIQHNLAVQIINPTPDPNAKAVPTSGHRMAGALKRYQEGKVIKPTTLKLKRSSSKSGSN